MKVLQYIILVRIVVMSNPIKQSLTNNSSANSIGRSKEVINNTVKPVSSGHPLSSAQ